MRREEITGSSWTTRSSDVGAGRSDRTPALQSLVEGRRLPQRMRRVRAAAGSCMHIWSEYVANPAQKQDAFTVRANT